MIPWISIKNPIIIIIAPRAFVIQSNNISVMYFITFTNNCNYLKVKNDFR